MIFTIALKLWKCAADIPRHLTSYIC